MNKKLSLIFLLIFSICTLSIVSITYSKFVYKENISDTLNVPEYNHCLANNINTLSDCIIVNENDAKTKNIATTAIANKTVDFSVASTTDEGLYQIEDDNGTSYYFRGLANDNYVSYAGFIWRIIRVNGDGSVRLIYSGTSTLDTADGTSIGTTKYNSSEITDMTLLGYKYGLNQQSKSVKNVIYNDLYSEKINSHANKINCDNSTNMCTLNDHIITEEWSSGYLSVLHWNIADLTSLWKKPKYTCWDSDTAKCNIYMEVSGRTDGGNSSTLATEVSGSYTGYISKSYKDTLTNDHDSTIKTLLDTWYENNILNQKDSNDNSYANYIADTSFCNDRTLSSGDGNTLSADSVYNSYNRNTTNKNPSLICTQPEDKFSTTSTKGNGTLTYPIGLITADEITLSGIVSNGEEYNSYLNTGISYWTMSPGFFSVTKLSENNYIMDSTGNLITEKIKNESAIRPVINLSKDVLITRGNGTVSNPYEVIINTN